MHRYRPLRRARPGRGTRRRSPVRPATLAALAIATAAALGCTADDDDDGAPPADDAPVENLPPSAPVALGGAVLVEPGLAIELDWQPATDADGVVVGYDVERDEVALAEGLDATRFRDTSVAPGRVYRYTVFAVDDRGARGEGATMELVSPEPIAVLNQGNHMEVVAEVLAVYAGKLYAPAIFAGPAFVDANEPISVEVVDPQVGVTRSVYGCANGGSATVTEFAFAAGAGRGLTQRYESCEWSGRVHDGDVDYLLEPYGRASWTYAGFVLSDEEGRRVLVDGTARRGYAACKYDSFDTWEAELERYEDEIAGLRLDDVATVLAHGVECLQPNARLEGGFTLSSTHSGGQPLVVETPLGFVNESGEERRFPRGRLEIGAADGSAVVLDTDDGDGDDATLALTLESGGTSETRSVPWDDWRELLSLDDGGADDALR